MFEQTILHFITSHQLLSKKSKYLVALSGGPDSVALLRVLKSLGYSIEAAHCNFHLRGAESDRDEMFCKSLCEGQCIPFHVVHFDTVEYAHLHKISFEMAARNLRYHWFAQLCHDLDAAGICVAHHQNDQVETVLLNLLRGTGLKGLTGMKAKARLNDPVDASKADPLELSLEPKQLLRPLLCVNEAQILAYLSSINQDYVIDSTNLEDDVQRNKLRLDIIPLLEKVNPAVTRNIIRMTENLQGAQSIVDDSLQQAAAAAHIKQEPSYYSAFSTAKISEYVSPMSLLWYILSPNGFNRPQVEEMSASINKGENNKEWQSHSHVAILTRNEIYLINRQWWEHTMPTLRIPEPGLYRYGNGSLQDQGQPHLHISRQLLTETFSIPKESNQIAIDAEKVTFPLTLRPAKDGDRFHPFGMRGTKLVSDYLKDRKRSIIDRHHQLVLTDATGTIVWLVGECIADSCKVTLPAKGVQTHSILLISFE